MVVVMHGMRFTIQTTVVYKDVKLIASSITQTGMSAKRRQSAISVSCYGQSHGINSLLILYPESSTLISRCAPFDHLHWLVTFCGNSFPALSGRRTPSYPRDPWTKPRYRRIGWSTNPTQKSGALTENTGHILLTSAGNIIHRNPGKNKT
jgi:hypothetical protein